MNEELTQIANRLTLKNISLPVKLSTPVNPILFKIYNDCFESRETRKDLLLPNFSETDTVAIFSDYGGEIGNSKYLTYTFTFVNYDLLGLFGSEISKIRKKYRLNDPYKEVSFKDLRYGPINRALDDYLSLIDFAVHGLVFTVIVDRSITSLLGDNSVETQKKAAEELEANGFGHWKPKSAEKLQRIIMTIAYLTRLLVPSGKKIFWMTDEDSIVANSKLLNSTGRIFNNAIHQFDDVSYDLVGYATPFEKGKDPLFLDLLSISDLVAGSIEHYFTRKTVLDNLTIKDGANKILMWHAHQGFGLKKLSLVITSENEGLLGRFVDFKLVEPPDNPEYINIYF